MLKEILEAFTGGPSTQPSVELGADVKRLAAAALMVEAARRDTSFDESERAAIVNTLRDHFHVGDKEAHALLDAAAERQHLPYAESLFTKALADGFTPEEREEVVAMVWEVAYADGRLHRLEARMIAVLGAELGLDPATVEAARAAAAAKLSAPS